MKDHQPELVALLQRFALSQRRAARLLSAATGDRIGESTFHRWVNRRDAPSARRCPGWVVYVLEAELGG